MSHSLATLRKWGVTDKELPSVEEIKHIHVYDFDNTLFASPLPNTQLWNKPTIGLLQTQNTFANGGWWHDSNILASTGEGLEKEEAKAWEGWWNGQIVNLVELTMLQKDALNILLTGRSVAGFAELLQRIVKSKGLDFHIISLKPAAGPLNQKFSSTGDFKKAFLEDVMQTYRDAEEIRIYEDRPNHVAMFRQFFNAFNESLSSKSHPEARQPIQAEVIEVSENATNLDPVAEVAEVQRMINAHNLAYRNRSLPPRSKAWEIKRGVLYTGYLISPPDTERLLAAANLPSSKDHHDDIRTIANNIMITPRPCPENILNKVGGLGKKLSWRVTAVGSFDNKVWAARVEPIPSTAIFHCENSIPYVVLAIRGIAKPLDASRITNWRQLPSSKAFEFETVVGEKVLLRIDEERPGQNEISGVYQESRGFKRVQPFDDEFPALGSGQTNPPRHKRQPFQRTGPQNYNDAAQNDENRRPSGPAGGGQSNRGSGGGSQRGRGGGQFQGRGGGGGRGGGFGGSRGGFQRGGGGGGGAPGRGRGRGGSGGSYRSLDDQGSNHNGRRRDHGMDGATDQSGLTY